MMEKEQMTPEQAIAKVLETVDSHTDFLQAITAVLVAKGIVTVAEMAAALEEVKRTGR